MFKWLKKQNQMARKTAGLEEKEKSTQKKFELANKISTMFDRRKETTPIEPGLERRHSIIGGRQHA